MKRITNAAPVAPVDAEKQLKTFVEKFEPKHQALIRAVRKALRKRFPTAYELAYDNLAVCRGCSSQGALASERWE